MTAYRVCVSLSGLTTFKVAEKLFKMPTLETDDYIENISNVIRSEHLLSIGATADSVGIDKESVKRILHNNFNQNFQVSTTSRLQKCLY